MDSQVGKVLALAVHMFFQELAQTIKNQFEQILESPSFLGLKRKKIQLVSSERELNNELSLYVGAVRILQDDRSTFRIKVDDQTYRSFRTPQMIEMDFALIEKSLSATQKLDYLERLQKNFFNQKTIPPFIPSHLQTQNELVQRMTEMKAEILPRDASDQWSFHYPFLYRGPFHHGQSLEKGPLVQKRILNTNSSNQERSST